MGDLDAKPGNCWCKWPIHTTLQLLWTLFRELNIPSFFSVASYKAYIAQPSQILVIYVTSIADAVGPNAVITATAIASPGLVHGVIALAIQVTVIFPSVVLRIIIASVC